MNPRLSRVLTIVAASVLAFDGAALIALGWWSGRLLLLLVGVICFASAGLVMLYWRWYRRRLDAIGQLRRELAEETRELRRSLSEN